ncbi:MAG: N-6 DNA methylase [Armatimonadetes bacterium]|nr:N-6 DNA methylase [Armatimonadota bacterium]
MPDAPDIIKELVERYESNRNQYRSASYNEEQTRAEFLNPFFEALGWDVRNKQGYSPAYMDVVFEGTIRVEGNANAPDYTFRVGQTRKFFVEAKKPAVSINLDAGPAGQIRRYSWTAKLPLGVLTNFHEFAVYDCRTPPKPSDKASHARLMYVPYTEYASRWEEIAGIFSRDAVWRGSFDKYAAADKGKRGTAEVDQEFLKQIEEWRTVLARNLALRNPGLDVRELNYAVQNTIDRIVFLRMCEDRGIEPQGQLLGRTSGPNVYGRLLDLYHAADAKYNSGLFHFSEEKGRPEAPDTITPGLAIDDKALRDMIAGLYYPQSPYEFSVIGADILGSVYEQFLGKVIRLTPGHTAMVEEKPEVKKAGGVYYTPTYIVDYIVRNTVGKLCEGKTPKQVEKLRIVDPACGSGSFLISAYAFLLSWHLDYYVKHEPEKFKKAVYHLSESEWRLTTSEKKRILLNSIYGVDIDSQAVEVTKLSLLLKVLEGESRDTLDVSLSMFHERALPDLSANIKCGNSLIGTDFDTSGLSDDEVRRINAFDWEDGFPAIMKAGGFDAVIGNPPYVRQESISQFKTYLQAHYQAYASAADLYVYFIERSLQLARESGLFSFIVSSKFVRSGYGGKLRQLMPSQSVIREFLDFADLPVFQGATVYPCIFILQKENVAERRDGNNVEVCNIKTLDFGDLGQYVSDQGFAVPQSALKNGDWQLHPALDQQVLSRMDAAGIPLPEYCRCQPLRGVLTGLNEVFIVKQPQIEVIADSDDRAIFLPYVRGRNVRRYTYSHTGEYLLFTDGISEKSHPHVMAYLNKHKADLEQRTDIQHPSKKWYELRPCSYYDVIRKPKIVYASVASRASFALDDTGIFVDKTCYFIPRADKYLLGLLNSRPLFFYFSRIAVERRGGYYEYLTEYVSRLPIRAINFDDPDDKARHDRMVELVDRMLDLHKRLDAATLPNDKTQIQRQIAATDREIDRLVYELYGLTDEEIKIVEGTG